jgi:LysM repeat protein
LKGEASALSGSTIGIKVADGSYYPVLESGFKGRKKLVLTTVKDNQDKVQIDLYRGNGGALADARYIGTLIIENIPPAAQGEPEIELLIGLDESGELSAEASDASTGETQDFSTSLATLTEEQISAEPEFSLESEQEEGLELEEPALTGEDYLAEERERREDVRRRQRPPLILIILFVVLSIALVAAIAFFVYKAVQGPKISTVPPTAATQQQTPAKQTATAQTSTQTATPQATTPAATTQQPAKKAVTYRIKNGDTLWDIASTYYRNPWLYPKLAKANGIQDPDLIFAGTQITIPEN